MIPAMAPPPSRRTVLAAGVWGAAAALAGCRGDGGTDTVVGPTDGSGVTPTDGAGEPIRPSAPDLALLLATLQDTRRLITQGAPLVEGPRGGTVRSVSALLGEQQTVLEELLTAAEVDPGPSAAEGPDTARSTTATPPDDAATTTTARTSPEALLADWASALAVAGSTEALGPLAGAAPENLPLLVSLAGQRTSAARAIGADVEWTRDATRPGAGLATLLDALRPAVYALEVVTARSADREQDRAATLLQQLDVLTAEVTALVGADAGPPPLGYGLPSAVDTAALRAQLVTEVLAPLPAATLDGVADLTGDEPGIAWSVRTLSDVVGWGAAFDRPLTAFPGMTTP